MMQQLKPQPQPQPQPRPQPYLLVFGEHAEDSCRQAGFTKVIDFNRVKPNAIGGQLNDYQEGKNQHHLTILIPPGAEDIRDSMACQIGDEYCSWAYFPEDPENLQAVVMAAKRMWIDEVARMTDIPDPGPESTYKSGFKALDDHGFRFVLPAFMPVVGPYGSGKSVLLRQLAVKLWRLHGWKFLITAFEERVKPRMERDLRRHFIGKNENFWADDDLVMADKEIAKAAVFLRRKRSTLLTPDRLIDRIEFAVRVYGVKVVMIDPFNEIDHQIPKGTTKTDYVGSFIMELKQLADDYNLLMIVALHPPKDGVEKRLSKNGLLTLNDGADSANWGNKADIGWCVWRDFTGPTYLHIDKLKDHESMGEPTVAELHMNKQLNSFSIDRVGYSILRDKDE